MISDQMFIDSAIRSFLQVVGRIGAVCSNLSEDQLLSEVAPHKNRVIYIWGHLTAIHDAMLPVLRLGERLHPELDIVFVSHPDRSVPLPAVAEIRGYWDDVHTLLLLKLPSLSPADWLERHGSVSPEDFARDPTRNRLAVLLSRTNHSSYHLGQIVETIIGRL
jgi:hypothetical protein